MKKSIKILLITTLVVSTLLLCLTGCSSTPYHKYLNTNWDKNDENKMEVATYDYTFKKDGMEDITGVLTSKIYKIFEEKTVTVGDKEVTAPKGASYFSYELLAGEYKVVGEVCFTGNKKQPFMPIASYYYKKQGENVVSTTMQYTDKKCTVTDNNGVTAECDLNKNGLVFDNVQLQAIARTLNFNQKGSLNFQTPFFNKTLQAKNVAIGGTTLATVNTAKEEGKEPDFTFDFIRKDEETAGFNAMVVLLTLNDKPAGIPQTMLVATGDVMVNGETFTQPLLRINEGSKEKGMSTYILTNLTKVAL